jgi:hypothetical protein
VPHPRKGLQTIVAHSRGVRNAKSSLELRQLALQAIILEVADFMPRLFVIESVMAGDLTA